MRIRFALTLLVFLVRPALAQEAASLFEKKTVIYTGGEYQEETFNYLIMKPETIEEGKRYPLVLFLHGAGERGDDNSSQAKHFPEHFNDPAYRKKFPCFILAPQCRKEKRWSKFTWDSSEPPADPTLMNVALQAFQDTLDAYPIDRSRLYLTGLSMGGYGSWELSMNRPDWFAGMAPICGAGDVGTAHRIVSMPIWNYHGDADTAVPVHHSQEMIAALQYAGGLPRYTEIPGRGHDSWVPAYKRDGVLNWLFRQRLPSMTDKTLSGFTALTSAHSPLRKGERIVFLGDSLTAAGVGPEGYITLLQNEFNAKRADLGVQFIGAGIGGHKVPDIQARFDRDVLSYDPTVVFVFIGVNDVWHTQTGNGTSKEDYAKGLLDVLSRIRSAGATAILATPPVVGEKRNGENALDAMLEEYAEISRKVAARMGTTICDLRETMPAYLAVFNEDNAEQGILTTDRVHYTAAGNRFVANHAAMAIYEALAAQGE